MLNDNAIKLPLYFLVKLLLSHILTLLLLSTFVLFVEDRIPRLQNVHLQQCTRSIFFSRNDSYLLLVVFQFSHHVVEYCLETVQVPPHRELVFSFIATDQRVLPLNQIVHGFVLLI